MFHQKQEVGLTWLLMATALRGTANPKKAQYYSCVEACSKCRFITNLQVTNITENKNKHTHDANFEDLDDLEERFRNEFLAKLKEIHLTKSKKKLTR